MGRTQLTGIIQWLPLKCDEELCLSIIPCSSFSILPYSRGHVICECTTGKHFSHLFQLRQPRTHPPLPQSIHSQIHSCTCHTLTHHTLTHSPLPPSSFLTQSTVPSQLVSIFMNMIAICCSFFPLPRICPNAALNSSISKPSLPFSSASYYK